MDVNRDEICWNETYGAFWRRDMLDDKDAGWTASELGKYVPGNSRKSRRPPPFWMVLNMHHGGCWCGRPRDQWGPLQRKYCCGEHGELWRGAINTIWERYRGHLVRTVARCEVCGRGFPPTVDASYDWGNTYDYHEDQMDVDHIEALELGGSMWDSNNHQVLCKDCHIIKTGCDAHKIARRRRKRKLEERHRREYGGRTLLDYADG